MFFSAIGDKKGELVAALFHFCHECSLSGKQSNGPAGFFFYTEVLRKEVCILEKNALILIFSEEVEGALAGRIEQQAQ